ncbi:MAG: hypothetical protein P1U86_12190 [Verrucomicrobiales bacterium]|nr:hypothetical protein [Verrucomicrobiales bacterium]
MINRLAIPLLLCAVFCAPAFAALPPLSPEELEASADAIIVGKVDSAEVEIAGSLQHSIYQVKLSVTVGAVEKGAEIIKPSQELTIHCWRLRKAQNGWAGPSGQNNVPAEGSDFRAWIRKNEAGNWEALEPNGISLTGASGDYPFHQVEKGRMKALRYFIIAGAILITGIFLYASRGRRS